MQSVSSRIWTRIAVFISYGDNDYTIWCLCKSTNTAISMCGNVSENVAYEFVLVSTTVLSISFWSYFQRWEVGGHTDTVLWDVASRICSDYNNKDEVSSSNIISNNSLENVSFYFIGKIAFNIIDKLSIAFHAFSWRMLLTSLSVDETLLPRHGNLLLSNFYSTWFLVNMWCIDIVVLTKQQLKKHLLPRHGNLLPRVLMALV